MTTAIIVGAGVSGLSCGVRLQEQGISTRILARERSPQTTSDRAAAIWFPFQAEPADRILVWCRDALSAFERLYSVPGAGVSQAEFVKVYLQPTPDEPWMTTITGRYRRCRPEELPGRFVDGVICRVPLIEVQQYMPWLVGRYLALGGQIETEAVTDLGALADRCDVVVNCTGLGAAPLVGDRRLYPIRGQILYVHGWPSRRAWSSDLDLTQLAYIIPRSDVCVLGGTSHAHRDGLAVDARDTAAILARCAELEPAVVGCTVVGAAVGLRPGRDAVRLEAERLPGGGRVVHNYGHAGAGFTLSWGCADEVAALVRQAGLAAG